MVPQPGELRGKKVRHFSNMLRCSSVSPWTCKQHSFKGGGGIRFGSHKTQTPRNIELLIANTMSAITPPNTFDNGCSTAEMQNAISGDPEVHSPTTVVGWENTDAKVVSAIGRMPSIYFAASSPITERIMVPGRIMWKKGEVFIDEPQGANLITSELAAKVAKRVLVVTTSGTRGKERSPFYILGAGAFVDHCVATALHNLTFESKDDVLSHHTITCPFLGQEKALHFHGIKSQEELENVNVGGGEIWKYGTDIYWGATEAKRGTARECEYGSFESVDEYFKIKKGMKIAFAALNKIILGDDDSEEEKKEQRSLVFGPLNKVNVYTGEVTGVYDTYFTHNINTKRGLSGGVIFLTDGSGQSSMVAKKNHGKAIGIHVGNNRTTGCNLGFKLSAASKIGFWTTILPAVDDIKQMGLAFREWITKKNTREEGEAEHKSEH